MQYATIQLKPFCEILSIPDREVRYILEEGYLPKGVAANPSTGNRREFNPGQAFWLAIVVKLKQTGLKTRLASEIAESTLDGLHNVTQIRKWDPGFLPHNGRFQTVHRYYMDIADLTFIRLVTDANPNHKGLYEFDWSTIQHRTNVGRDLAPFVILRIDLKQIAARLATVEGWSGPRAQSHF
jgi:hypothetical protein